MIGHEKEMYKNISKEIKAIYQKSNSWEKVSEYLCDDSIHASAFVDLVQDVYKVEVKDPIHFNELTGLDSILPDDFNLEHILINSRVDKYSEELNKILSNGGTYNDLLNVKIKDYKLPNTWKSGVFTNKESTILWTINFFFLINEPAGTLLIPSLRKIGEEIKAPYSVMMEVYNLTH